jgi:tetratricopeptide (TPR) repeat protein
MNRRIVESAQTSSATNSDASVTDEPARVPRPHRRLRRKRRLLWGIVLVGSMFLVRGWLASLLNESAIWCLDHRHHASAENVLLLSSFLSGSSPETHYLLSIACRRQRDFERTTQHLQRAFDLGWDADLLEREQRIALAQTGQYEKLIGKWDRLFLNAGADGPEISEAYTDVLLARFDLESALTILAAWELDFPDDPRPHIRRGQVLTVVRNWKDAETEYLTALQLDPESTEARLALANCRMEQLRFEEALGDLQRALTSDPDNAEAIVSLAVCLRKLQRTGEAIALLDAHAATVSQNVDALREMAKARLDNEQPEQALAFLKKAVAINPIDREIRYLNAQALQAVGRHEEAQAEFDFVNQATRPVLRLTQLVPQLVDRPSDVELRFEIAEITWKYKSREEGANWFHSLLQFDPNHRPTHAALARHYELLHDEKQAAWHRQRAGNSAAEPK